MLTKCVWRYGRLLQPKFLKVNLGESKQLEEKAGPRKNHNGYKCHKCGSEYHLNRDCPQNSGDPTAGTGTQTKEQAWRYLKPADDNSSIEVNVLTYYYCKHCKCKKTGKQGFYNRTHTSSKTATTDGHMFPRMIPETDESSIVTNQGTVSTAVSSISAVSGLTVQSNYG